MRVFMRILSGILCLVLSTISIADNQIVVVVMEGPEAAIESGEPPPRPPLPDARYLVNVSLAGDGDFADLAEAMESITDADYDKPYLILLAPGEYELTEPLTIKPYVSIRGAGIDQTRIFGKIASFSTNKTAALLVGSQASTVSLLLLENMGNYSYTTAIGFYNYCDSCQLLDMEIRLSNLGNHNYGVYNYQSGVEGTNLKMVVDSGFYNKGFGIYDSGTFSDYFDLNIRVQGSSGSRALYIDSQSDTVIEASFLSVNPGQDRHALYISIGGDARIVNTHLIGTISTPPGNQCIHITTATGSGTC